MPTSRLLEIETRLSAIRNELETPDADITALTTETDNLLNERATIKANAEQRKSTLDKIARGLKGTVVADSITTDEPEKRTYDASSPVYRTAFFKSLLDREMTTEERAAFTHTTENTPAVLPTTTVNQIWDLVYGQHCILNDVTVYRTGTILEVVKHTEIVQGKAKKTSEGVANDAEQNTLVKVKLTGNDFTKFIDISYAEAKMSIDALEQYLINEIALGIGEAMAEDTVETVSSGINTANKQSVSELDYATLTKAFGLLKRVSGVVLYATRSTIYNHLVAMTDNNGRPIFQPSVQKDAEGSFLGGIIKVEDAVPDGKILIGDPKKVVYNMVQDIMLETDKDVKNHTYTYSGYARGEGALIDDKAFAEITITV